MTDRNPCYCGEPQCSQCSEEVAQLPRSAGTLSALDLDKQITLTVEHTPPLNSGPTIYKGRLGRVEHWSGRNSRSWIIIDGEPILVDRTRATVVVEP